jgi:cytochrome bd-type quinol oxidase subunit 2
MNDLLQWLFWKFGAHGGVYLVAALVMVVASDARPPMRFVLCVVSWLIIVAGIMISLFAVILTLAGQQHVSYDNETKRFVFFNIGGIALAVVAATTWSYWLFRKPKPLHGPVSPHLHEKPDD